MKTYAIYRKNNPKPIFNGTFESFAICVEHAVEHGINLRHANFKHANLSNANLDSANFEHADFSFCNLTGTNLSECNLQNSTFRGASLYNTCLAFSALDHADLRYANLGGTDLSGATLSYGKILCSDAHKLDWMSLAKMEGCHFEDQNQNSTIQSTPPIIIIGVEKQPIIDFESALSSNGIIKKQHVKDKKDNTKNKSLTKHNHKYHNRIHGK